MKSKVKMPSAQRKEGGSSHFFSPAVVYPKLTVNAPNDKYEQEADAMADRVMRMPQADEEQVQMKPLAQGIQRKCSACGEEEVQRDPIMRQASGGGFEAPADVSRELQSSKGSGKQLGSGTLQRMNRGFGTDFSNVRVHTDARAQRMSQNIQAKAFTHGPDVYFNRGAYQPGSSGGDRLLAHELTHVVQQGGGKRIQRKESKKKVTEPGEVPTYTFGTFPLTYTYKASISSGQWYDIDRQNNSDVPEKSFWQAAVYNTKNDNHTAYKSIAQRHSFYNFAHAYLNSTKQAIKSKWFKAAAIVTSKNAVGASEGTNLWILSDKTDAFLKAGNKFLFGYNMKNFSYLMKGQDIPGMKGLRGKYLDNKMVEFEQGKVGDFIKKYTEIDSENIDDILKEVNSSFALNTSLDPIKQVAALFTPQEIKEVIKENFTDKKITFDFNNYNHRVTLGKKIIKKLY